MHRSLPLALAATLLSAAGLEAREIYVSNEKGNSITVIDGDKLEVTATIPVGNRPRGIILSPDGKHLYVCASDDDTIEVMDTDDPQIIGNLPSGPDPELMDISPTARYVRRQRGRQHGDGAGRRQRQMLSEIPVGVEPEGMGISHDGKWVVNTSETTNMAHFIDTDTHEITDNVLVDQRPRFAELTSDDAEVWVSAEIGGTVSVIDNATRQIKHKITFEIPGVPKEAIQPVGVRVTKDRKRAFVALGPVEPGRGGRRPDLRGQEVSAGRAARLAARLQPGREVPLQHQRRLQRHLGDRRRNLEVIKSVTVGAFPWGVAVKD